MVTQKEIKHMAPKIPISTHNMATKSEYEPLPWYLSNTVVDPETGEILQYKDLLQAKEEENRNLYQNRLSK